MKVKSESEVAQSLSRVALSDPMDCSLGGSSIHGIFQARVLEWGVITFSAGLMTSWQIEGEIMETMRDFIFLGSKSLKLVTAPKKKIKDICSLEEKLSST